MLKPTAPVLKAGHPGSFLSYICALSFCVLIIMVYAYLVQVFGAGFVLLSFFLLYSYSSKVCTVI